MTAVHPGLQDWLPDPDVPWPRLPGLPAEWSLPTLPLPDLPVPDLPGTTMHWAVLLPVLAAAIGMVLVRRGNRPAAWAAVTPAVLTLGVTLWQLYGVLRGGEVHVAGTIGPLPLGEVRVPLELMADRLTALVAVVVAVVALVVQVFARWYLWFDPRYRQFAATVSLFTGAMLLVVHSSDVVLTLVGWEVMGWCSFLLIGHLSVKERATRAAGKALLVTRVADVGFVLGLIALAVPAGSTAYDDILRHWAGAPDAPHLAMVLLVVGVAGKSAQVPFQDWLPDAMEGPAPASALIHAATMVAAGTVVLAVLFPVLQASGPARLLLAVLASVTAVLAALVAFAQPDLKRLLAWSTVSQVALMLAALTVVPGGGGPDAAVMHLMAHAWFKALLFLTVGWLSVLTGSTLVAYVSGATVRYRSLRSPLAIGLLSLAGVPPLVGFVSKELVLAQAEAGVHESAGPAATIVLAAVGASVPLTAAYCMRAWLVLSQQPETATSRPVRRRRGARPQIDDFFTEPEVVEEAVGVEEADSAISASARAGLTVLTLLTVVGGVLAFTPLIQVDVSVNLTLVLAALLLMAAAALAVWGASRGVRTGDAAARLPAAVSLAMERGLGADNAYRGLVARPVLALARGVTWLDREVLDGYVRAGGHATRLAGQLGQRLQPRLTGTAVLWVLAGALVVGAAGVALR